MARWIPAPSTDEQAALAAQIRKERDQACIDGIARLAAAGAFDPPPAKPHPSTPRRPRRAL